MKRPNHVIEVTDVRTLPALALIGALILPLVGCNGLFGGDDETHLSRGLGYYGSGDLAASIIEFRNALQQNPENARARFYLGVARLKTGDYATARRDLELAKELGYDAADLALPLARARFVSGDHAEVLTVEPSASFTQTDTAEFHALRGRAALGINDTELARAEFRKALAADPGVANARFGRALLAQANNDAEGMREWVDRTLSADGNHVEAWRMRALLDLAQGRYGDAEKSLSRMIDHSAMPAPVELYQRVILRLQRGAIDEARKDAERLRRVAPDLAGARYALGLVEFYQGHVQAAQTEMEAALSRDERFAPARLMLGVIHGDAGRFEQARHQLERYRVLEPDMAVGSLMLAALEAKEGNAESAREKLAAHIQQYPADRQAQTLRAALDEGEVTDGAMTRLAFSIMGNPSSGASGKPSPSGRGAGELAAGDRQTGERPGEEQLQDVHTALIAGQFGTALQRIEALIEQYPHAAALYNLKAAAHFGLDDLQRGVESLLRAVNLDPTETAAVRNLGELLVGADRSDMALQLYRRAYEANPRHLDIMLKLARLEGEQGNPQRAEELVVAAIETHPEALEPRLIHARLLLGRGAPQEALDRIEPLQDEYAGHPEVLFVRGVAFGVLGEFERAREAWIALIRQTPENERVLMGLARSQLNLGESASAREHLREAIRINPQGKEARLLVLRSYILDENYEAAESEFRTLLEQFEPTREMLAEAANLAFRRGDTLTALDRLREAQSVDPSEQGIITLADAYQRAGRADEAIGLLEDWYERESAPMSRGGRHMLASLHMTIGSEPAAVALYEGLLEENPDDVLVLNNLAWLLRETDARRAATLAQRAVTLAPESADLQHTLAVALVNSGRTAHAIDALERAVALSPRPDFRLKLAELYLLVGERQKARSILNDLVGSDGLEGQDRARELLDQLQDQG